MRREESAMCSEGEALFAPGMGHDNQTTNRTRLVNRPVLEIGHADLICKLVEQDMGISFLPDYITDSAVRKGTVTRLYVQNFQPDLWMQLLYHRNKWVSPAMQAVISHLSQSTLSR